MFVTMKERLAEGVVLQVCAIGRLVHHNLIQMLGLHGGYHAIWFDLEHMDYPTEKLEIGALAARSVGLDSFVRLAPTDYASITRVLEAGTSGIMAAQVQTAKQVEEIVRWAKFAPRGCRGMNSSVYDAGFARLSIAEFAEKANRETFIAIQIETAEALEECEAIAAVEGVDLLFVGPADLSQNLGVLGDFFHPRCLAALDRVSEACARQGKPWGVLPINLEYAQRCVERGCRLLSTASDVRILNAGIESVKQSFAPYFG